MTVTIDPGGFDKIVSSLDHSTESYLLLWDSVTANRGATVLLLFQTRDIYTEGFVAQLHQFVCEAVPSCAGFRLPQICFVFIILECELQIGIGLKIKGCWCVGYLQADRT